MKLFFLSVIAISIFSCKIMRESQNYHYSVNTCFGVNDKDSKITHQYLIYNNKIIELALRENKQTEVMYKTEIEKSNSTFDTLTVQFINPSDSTFMQIDSFKKDFKILKVGKYKESTVGLKLNISANIDTKTKMTELRDTLINNEPYKYNVAHVKDEDGNDSLLTRGYLIPRSNFLSVFNLFGVKNLTNKLAFAGFNIHFLKENFTYSILVKNVRKLTANEENICESIYSICEK